MSNKIYLAQKSDTDKMIIRETSNVLGLSGNNPTYYTIIEHVYNSNMGLHLMVILNDSISISLTNGNGNSLEFINFYSNVNREIHKINANSSYYIPQGSSLLNQTISPYVNTLLYTYLHISGVTTIHAELLGENYNNDASITIPKSTILLDLYL